MDDSALRYTLMGALLCALLVLAIDADAPLAIEYRKDSICMCLCTGSKQ